MDLSKYITENLDTIKSKLSDKLKDYKNCIEIVKNSFGKDLEVTLPFNSLYVKNNEYSLTINNTVWDNDDPAFYDDEVVFRSGRKDKTNS